MKSAVVRERSEYDQIGTLVLANFCGAGYTHPIYAVNTLSQAAGTGPPARTENHNDYATQYAAFC